MHNTHRVLNFLPPTVELRATRSAAVNDPPATISSEWFSKVGRQTKPPCRKMKANDEVLKLPLMSQWAYRNVDAEIGRKTVMQSLCALSTHRTKVI